MSLTKIDLGISVIGGPNQKDMKYIHITRNDVIQRIKRHPAIDSWTKEYLYKRINDYPDSALAYFVQNINQIVVNAINERSRIIGEQQNENRKKAASEIAKSLQQQSGGECESGIIEIGSQEIGGEIEIQEARKKKEKPSSPSAPSVEISLDSLEFAPIVEANVVWLVANVPFSIAGNRQIALSHRNWATIDCGFSAKVPEGYKLVLELSPDHKDHGLEVYKNTIVGENRVNLSVRNLGREIAVVNHRDRIALARIEPIYPLTFKVVGNS
jgi:hypothetical protein